MGNIQGLLDSGQRPGEVVQTKGIYGWLVQARHPREFMAGLRRPTKGNLWLAVGQAAIRARIGIYIRACSGAYSRARCVSVQPKPCQSPYRLNPASRPRKSALRFAP